MMMLGEGLVRDHPLFVRTVEMAPKVQCKNSQAKETGLDDTLENII